MKLLIKFPTRGRKDLFFATFNKFHEYAVTDPQFLISIDVDDPVMNNWDVMQRIKSYKNTDVCLGKSQSKAHAINRDIEGYDKEWDIVIIAADDTVPCVNGYDQKIIDAMQAHYPDTDGVLFFNDGFWGNELNTQCIIGKKYYERFGYVVYPGYKSLWFDNDFQKVGDLLGRQTYFDEVIVKHEHPSFGYHNSFSDEIHKKNEEHDNIDKKVYEKRKARLYDLNQAKIKVVHLLMKPLDGPYGEKQNSSMKCFDGLKEYVHAYTQQFSFPYTGEIPVDTCADPAFIRYEKPADDGPWLSYGHYGAYLAHKRAIIEEFSEDIDALVIVEGDVVFDISPADMANRFSRACQFAKEHDGSLVTFGNVGFGLASDASMRDTTVPMGDYTKIDHFVSAHCYMILKKEREQIQWKMKNEKWHAFDIWLYWNYDKRVPIFRTKEPLVYEPQGFSMIDFTTKEINVRL